VLYNCNRMGKKTKKLENKADKIHKIFHNSDVQKTDSTITIVQQMLYIELCDIEKKVIDNLKKDTDLQ